MRRLLGVILVVLIGLPAFDVPIFAVTDPTLPRSTVDTTYPTIGHTGHDQTVTSANCTTMQNAVNAVIGDDEIVISHGLDFTNCNIVLPHKTANAWTIIRTDAIGSLPVGTIVGSTDAANLVKFETATVAPAFDDANSANYWRLVGIEVTIPDSWNLGVVQNGLMLGYQHNAGETPATWPTHIIIDRSWIHCSATLHQDCKYGVAFNGDNQAVVDSTIEQIHHHYADSQAVRGFCGGGPYKIFHNELSATGETVLFGGADCANSRTVVPSDMEIKRNHMFKPLSWRPTGANCTFMNPATNPLWDGECWDIKNLLEFKTGRYLDIQGNIFENMWYGEQQYAIVFHSSNQNDGNGSPQAFNGDITFCNNIIKNVSGALSLYGNETGAASGAHNPPELPLPAARINICNVLIYPLSVDGFRMLNIGYNDQGGVYPQTPYYNMPLDVQFNHDTFLMKSGQVATALATYEDTRMSDVAPNWSFKDSIFPRPVTYGFGVSSKEGSSCYGGGMWPNPCALGGIFTPFIWNHMILDNDSGDNTSLGTLYPAAPLSTGTLVLTMHAGVNYVNYSDNAADYHDYALSPSSPGHLAASDSKDIGVDFTALDAALSGGVGVLPTITSGCPTIGGFRSVSYSSTLTATGDTPITWTIPTGSLPTGLALFAAIISGTPTGSGASSFTIQATNATGVSTNGPLSCYISITGGKRNKSSSRKYSKSR